MMQERTMQLYVKFTSNYPGGYPLTSFTILSEEWSGESIRLPFGEDGERVTHKVVGWTDLFFGSACPVHIVKVRTRDGTDTEGYLVYGGNSGVRILDKTVPVEDYNEHLPRGYSQPFVWVEDPLDFPEDVRRVIESGS